MIILDVETTISNKGNPFDTTNKLCYVGLKTDTEHYLFDIDYSGNPNKPNLDKIQSILNEHDTIVGFNIKFDLHWLHRYGIDFSSLRVWDCQLVHFILSGQAQAYPSLNGVADHYKLGSKLDIVSEEYWKNGIDTPNIPKDILEEYLKGDLDLTHQVYLKQLDEVKTYPIDFQKLISLHHQDLKVLQVMESNGILFDERTSRHLALETEQKIKEIEDELFTYHNLPEFNATSTEHLSAFLYGGSIKVKRREPVGFFKTGARKGEVKEQWKEYIIDFNRRVTPLRKSELAKEGFYSTEEQVLRSLRGSKEAKHIIQLILDRATLYKRLTTYYTGLVDLRESMQWKEGMLHGQLNQCVARTGRLSSSKPNMQNFDGEIKPLFRSRFNTSTLEPMEL